MFKRVALANFQVPFVKELMVTVLLVLLLVAVELVPMVSNVARSLEQQNGTCMKSASLDLGLPVLWQLEPRVKHCQGLK